MKRLAVTVSALVLLACSYTIAPIDGRDDLEAIFSETPAESAQIQTWRNEILSITPALSVKDSLSRLDALDRQLTDQPILLAASQLARADKLGQFQDSRAADAAIQAINGFMDNGLDETDAFLEAQEMRVIHADEADPEALIAILEAKTTRHGLDSPRLAETHVGLAGFAYGASDYAKAREHLDQALSLTETAKDVRSTDTRIIAYLRRASVSHDEGKTAEAIADSEAGLALAREYFDDSYPPLGELLANYSSALYQGARNQDAADVGNEAVQLLRAQTDGAVSTNLAIAMVNLAAAEHGLGNHARADRMFMNAYQAFLDLGGEQNRFYAGVSLDNAAKVANDLGRLQEADERYVKAQTLIIETLGPDHLNVGASYLTHADTLYRLGQIERAQKVGTDAANILSAAIGEDNIYTRLARSTALLAQAERDPDGVRDTVTAQTDASEAVIREAILSAEGWTQATQNMRMSLTQMALTALAAGDEDAAFRALQMTTLSSVSEADQRRALSRSMADPEGAVLAERLKDTQQRRQTLRARVTSTLSEGGEVSALRQEISSLDIQIDRLTQALFADDDAAALLTLASLADIQSSLSETEALLMPIMFYRAEGLLITRNGVYRSRGERDSALIRDAQRAFATRLQQGDTISPSDPFLSEISEGLFASAPMHAITQLYIVGQLPLGIAPISLVQDPAEPDQYLGERVAIARLPSAASLLREAPDDRAVKRGFLGIGDASFTGEPETGAIQIAAGGGLTQNSLMRGGTADIEAIRALPRLPETRAEISAIADTVGTSNSRLLLGIEAREATLRELDLTQYSLISFATHGLLSGEVDGLSEPALVLTPPQANDDTSVLPTDDGLLLASEISELDMDARLVILSACNSAEGLDTLVGLPQSFLTAGADALMVSRWPVRDDAARFLSVATVTAMQAGHSPSESLRQAVKALRESDLPGANDPRIFAPFEIIGR